MEDGKGYILAVSAPGANITATASNVAYAVPNLAKGGLELLVR